jgi:hypothetical protein
MALSPTVFVSQLDAIAATNAIASNIQTSQFDALVVFNIPSVGIYASQLDAALVYARQGSSAPVQISQLDAIIVCRGLTDDPSVRAWTFSLDGHDMYVLKLGNEETLVYDVLAEQWYEWATGDLTRWRAYTGRNWLGSRSLSDAFGSSIIVGDLANGALYFMDPDGFADDDPNLGANYIRPFLREITGQVATRGYDMVPCYGVSLMGSIGENIDATLTAVTLFTSDDEGHVYDEHDMIDVAPDDYRARIDWNSGLGSFEAPGRLFRVQDRGALQRIDWLDMADDPDVAQ